MENKGGFHEHLCPRECLPHPSAVSNKPGYFQLWVCFFIEEQAPECERNVLSKQRQWPQLCLKWDSKPEESFHTSRQKNEEKKKVLTTVPVRVCVRARPPPLPQSAKTTWPQRWLTLCVDTHTHWNPQKQTATRGFPQSLLSYRNLERIAVAAEGLLTPIKALVQRWMTKNCG